jgi:hypothetical protein
MAGGFALGEREPERGARVGERDGTRLVLRASLSIPCVKAFVADGDHAGSLDGNVSFGPIGSDLRSASGGFTLFAPTGDPSLKLMQYRLTFRRGTDQYCLHGAKQVRRGSPLRGWGDTTTLQCRLHAGIDATGPVIGAGILRISSIGFAKQLLSFRTVNGRTLGAKAQALGGFLAFFAGELVDSYLQRGSA